MSIPPDQVDTNPLQPEDSTLSRLHPAGIIMLWLFMAIALQGLHTIPLLVAGALVLAVASLLAATRLHTLLYRTRWIMLSLLLVYVYATPGEPLWAQAGSLSPTMDGLSGGGLQLLRLVAALAALSIALNILSRQELISGIYTLALPLRLLGVSRERLAVRLALTLDYAEIAIRQTAAGWRNSIERLQEPESDGVQTLQIQVQPMRLLDIICILLGATLLVPVLW